MEQITLSGTKREVIGKKVKQLRRQGKLPAVIYGTGIKPVPVLLDMKEASTVLASVGSSTVMTLKVDKEKHQVLVRDRQIDVIKRSLIHVDFLRISMTEKIRAYVRVRVVGVAPVFELFDSTLTEGLTQIEVEALPSDLPESIEVDISGMEKIGHSIKVSDLDLPAEITILEEEDAMIVLITAQRIIEEEVEEVEELDEEALEGEEGEGEAASEE